MPKSPILVATDLSARSDRAVDRAIQLAQEMSCPLMVAHVVEGMSAKERHELLSLAKPVLDREVLSLGSATFSIV